MEDDGGLRHPSVRAPVKQVVSETGQCFKRLSQSVTRHLSGSHHNCLCSAIAWRMLSVADALFSPLRLPLPEGADRALENEIPFTYRHLEEPCAAEERAAFWLLGRFPVLVDDGRTIAEYPAQARSRDYLHGSCLQIAGGLLAPTSVTTQVQWLRSRLQIIIGLRLASVRKPFIL
jgi:hypothetical protein